MEIGLLKTLEDLMVAVTFAEKDQSEFAKKILSPDNKRKNQRKVAKNNTRRHEDRPRMRL